MIESQVEKETKPSTDDWYPFYRPDYVIQRKPNLEKIITQKDKSRTETPMQEIINTREYFLFPFLSGKNAITRYTTHVLNLDERDFWNEIFELAEENRPRNIASLIKKRFSRRGKVYEWDTHHVKGWVKKSDSIYIKLTDSQQQELIGKITEGYEKRISEIERIFRGKRAQGHLTIGGKGPRRLREEFLYRELKDKGYLFFIPEDKMIGFNKYSIDKTRDILFLKYNKVINPRRIFVDLEHQKNKVWYVSQKLNDVPLSCDAIVRASSALFGSEFDLQHYQNQLTDLEQELKENYHQSVEFESDTPTIIKLSSEPIRGSKRQNKKIINRIKNLYKIISNLKISQITVQDKIDSYMEQELTVQQIEPVYKILSSVRINKRLTPNRKLLGAIEHVKNQAEQHYNNQNFKLAVTWHNVLNYFGKEYFLVKDLDERLVLVEEDPYKDTNKFSGLIKEIYYDPKITKRLRYNLSELTGSDISIWVEREKRILRRYGLAPSLNLIKKNEELVFSTIYRDKPTEVRFIWNHQLGDYDIILKNIGPSILHERYDPDFDPYLEPSKEELIPKEFQDHKGDIVFAENQLQDFINQLIKEGHQPIEEGHQPYINNGGTVRFKNDKNSRVELKKEKIHHVDYFRASIYGNLPLIGIAFQSSSLSFVDKIQKGLYSPDKGI